jgi:hypothetical protein
MLNVIFSISVGTMNIDHTEASFFADKDDRILARRARLEAKHKKLNHEAGGMYIP